MKVYKVVATLSPYDVMVSCRTRVYKNLTSPAVLTYEIGKVTRPAFGYIFCFKNKDDAIRFSISFPEDGKTVVLAGIGVPVNKTIKPRTVHISSPVETMISMWENLNDPNICRIAPNGTVLMRTFRPLEEVKINWED